MEKHIKDEKNGLTYSLGEDGMYYPDLIIEEEDKRPIGLFGRLHLTYIKENRNAFYTGMLLAGTLNNYLADLDRQAQKHFDRIITQMAESQGVTEDLKAADQMEWVGLMNNIRHCAREIVLNELIYQ